MMRVGRMLVRGTIAEQQGNAPESGDADEGIDDAADDGELAAADRCDDVEAEDADAPPVQRADDDKNQRNIIQYFHFVCSFPYIRVVSSA